MRGEVVELEPESLGSDGGNPITALIVRSRTKVTADVLASLPDLKVVGRAGVGVDNIDLGAATAAGVRVVNAPRASTHSVVELTMAHLLGSVRFLGPSDRAMREGRWIKKDAKGTELSGKRLGLVGYGRIARGVAAVAVALGMEVHAYDPTSPRAWTSRLPPPSMPSWTICSVRAPTSACIAASRRKPITWSMLVG